MSSKYRRMMVLVLLVSVVSLYGCAAVTPINIYSDFMTKKQQINSITMLGDFYIFDDVEGTVDLVDVPKNINTGMRIMDMLDDELKQKGYKTVHKDTTSMGLFRQDRTETFKLALSKSPSTSDEIKNLPDTNAPFYINKDFSDTPEKRKTLEAVMEKLGAYTRKEGEPVKYIPEVAQLSTGKNQDAYLFVLVSGRDVPLLKTIGQATATALLSLVTLGLAAPVMVAVAQTPWTRLDIFIVDAKTGEVVWKDGQYLKTQPHHLKNVKDMVEALAKRIPIK